MIAPAPNWQPEDKSARLIAIAGPLRGEALPLREWGVKVGRDPSNDICLADPALSHSHCAIDAKDGVWHVRDRESSNGTFVNGTQVTDHVLSDGDRIALGESVFLFAHGTPEQNAPALVERPGEIVARLPTGDTRYLADEPLPAGSRAERDLQALLHISATINSIRTEDDLCRKLLDLIRAAVPAEQAAAIVLGSDGGNRILHSCQAPGSPPQSISDTVVRQAIEERVSVLGRDLGGADAVHGAAAPSASRQSVLCAPMLARGRALGALYLSTIRKDAFDAEHLQLLTAIANVSAVAVDNVRQLASLEGERERLQAALERGHGIVGRSAAMERIYDIVAKVARSDDTTVLVTGETGTGKELVARAIHSNSGRAKRPFVAVNCAALSEALLETELFGHERGAFTGAVAQKKGKVELADGGTMFLDEVGELAPALQAKLLRALQQREFERVGGTRPVRVDVRVISATNRQLPADVAAGRFRSDLFHRLNVVQIDVPALRDRREDIPELANYFVGRFALKATRPIRGIAPDALKCLTSYDWPGNVRELENTIERAIVLGSSDYVLREDLPDALLESTRVRLPERPRFHELVREAKSRAIVDAFREAGRSYADAARLLGLHPNYLHRLIRNLDLKSALERGT